jgi:hypothetical protein
VNDELHDVATHYRVEASVDAGSGEALVWTSSSSTSPLRKVSSFLLPIVAAVGVHGLPGEERIRAVSRGRRSATVLSDIAWIFDGWTYSQDPVDVEQIRALNELLTLNVDEGLFLDYPE